MEVATQAEFDEVLSQHNNINMSMQSSQIYVVM